MFFTFPRTPDGMSSGRPWSSASSSVNTAAWSGSPGACLNACCRSGLLPSGALKRTTYVAERKLRRRQLAEDGNVEITGRDLHEGSAAANARGSWTIAGRLSRD
jgi:hypothetical protein